MHKIIDTIMIFACRPVNLTTNTLATISNMLAQSSLALPTTTVAETPSVASRNTAYQPLVEMGFISEQISRALAATGPYNLIS